VDEWAFEAEAVNDLRLEMALNILKNAIQRREFEAAATVSRAIRTHYPACISNLRMLSLLSPWLPLNFASSKTSSQFSLLVNEIDKCLNRRTDV
jgi:hypothetical protein